MIYLIGTNADKQHSKNIDDAKFIVDKYKMKFFQISCLNTKQVNDVIQDAILTVCKNIDEKVYVCDKSRYFEKNGIIVIGDREIIDNPPIKVDKKVKK